MDFQVVVLAGGASKKLIPLISKVPPLYFSFAFLFFYVELFKFERKGTACLIFSKPNGHISNLLTENILYFLRGSFYNL